MITAVFNTFSRELKKNMLNTAVVHHTQRSKTLEQGMITAVFNTFSSGPKKNMLNTAVVIQPEEERGAMT
jgi:hypothetical protein